MPATAFLIGGTHDGVPIPEPLFRRTVAMPLFGPGGVPCAPDVYERHTVATSAGRSVNVWIVTGMDPHDAMVRLLAGYRNDTPERFGAPPLPESA